MIIYMHVPNNMIRKSIKFCQRHYCIQPYNSDKIKSAIIIILLYSYYMHTVLLIVGDKVSGIEGQNLYLVVQSDGIAYWSNTVLTCEHSIIEDQLVKLIKLLVDNIYIQVGNKIFRQTIGIPMGTDCAPLLANLFLFYYEYKFMKEKLKQSS